MLKCNYMYLRRRHKDIFCMFQLCINKRNLEKKGIADRHLWNRGYSFKKREREREIHRPVCLQSPLIPFTPTFWLSAKKITPQTVTHLFLLQHSRKLIWFSFGEDEMLQNMKQALPILWLPHTQVLPWMIVGSLEMLARCLSVQLRNTGEMGEWRGD